MVVFLVLMTLIWMIPIYSLVKDSLKVNGIQNYVYVLTNKINGVPFYRYFMNSAINAVGASLLLSCNIRSNFDYSVVLHI